MRVLYERFNQFRANSASLKFELFRPPTVLRIFLNYISLNLPICPHTSEFYNEINTYLILIF